MAEEAPDTEISPQVLVALVGVVQCGVWLNIPQPCSVFGFLQETLELSESLIASIQTVILDSKVVDDMNAAWMTPGCRLALSAAMPGLVGAALRRGGKYAPMREGIEHTFQVPDTAYDFWIELRLYNSMISGVSPVLLQKGCLVRRDRMRPALEAFLQDYPRKPPKECPESLFCFLQHGQT